MHITFAYIPHSYLSTLLVTHSFCAFAFGRQLAQWAATGNYAMWRIQYNLWHSRTHPLPTNEKKHNYPTSKNNCILFSHLTLCLNHNSKGRIPGRRGSYLQHLVSWGGAGNTYIHICICIYGVDLQATLSFCAVSVMVTAWTPIVTNAIRAGEFGIHSRSAVFPASSTIAVAWQPQHKPRVGEGGYNRNGQ